MLGDRTQALDRVSHYFSRWKPILEAKSIATALKTAGNIFWDSKRIVLFNYLERIIAGKYYCIFLTKCISKFVRRGVDEEKSSFTRMAHLFTKGVANLKTESFGEHLHCSILSSKFEEMFFWSEGLCMGMEKAILFAICAGIWRSCHPVF